MKVSLKWAQKYSNLDVSKISLAVLLQKIGAQLGAVEDVEAWGPRFDDAVVVKVLSCIKHPNADRLSICIVDDGGVVSDVQRTEEDKVQVVCGALNVRAGISVVWLPPGAVVPATRDTDPFTLEAREIRGHVSNGMLASAAELGLSDDHAGILELTVEEDALELVPGTPFKDLYDLDDTIIDCENKMFTHRPDCFGVLGVARELAGITGQAFKSPTWYLDDPEFASIDDGLPLTVYNEIPELVPRLMVVVIDSIQIAPSPTWLQIGLKKVGIRSVNNVVDVTNFMMQLTGQPMHAFDYDKIKHHSKAGPTLGARMARENEKMNTLSGKSVVLTNKDIVLATDAEPADLAGIMGAASTEVDETTKTIVLTCATFDMYAIRRSSMRHGVFTDAVTRYTKGQSPLQNDRVLAYAMRQIIQMAGGMQASKVYDEHAELPKPNKLSVDVSFINGILGSNLTALEASDLLKNVEIRTEVHGNTLDITAPFWRTDLGIAEDIVEEIGRLYGYDKLPISMPVRSSKPPQKNVMLELKSKARDFMSDAGSNELLTYSFIHGDLLDAAGQDREQAYKLANALSPDLQYYRQSLTPSLLDKVNRNIRAGSAEFVIYEINKVHSKLKIDDDSLPEELEHLAAVISVEDKRANEVYDGAPFYQSAKYLWSLLAHFGVDQTTTLLPLGDAPAQDAYLTQLVAPFEPKRSALVVDSNGSCWGVIGEYRAALRRKLKLPRFTAGLELDLQALADKTKPKTYHQLSRFPHTSQDITFSMTNDTSFQALANVVNSTLADVSHERGYRTQLRPLDIFQKETGKKHVSFRIVVTHPARTLKTTEINELLDRVARTAKQQLSTERV